MLARIKAFFQQLNLSQRFMIASLVILFAGLLGIGAWVEGQITAGVVRRTGATTALYVDSFVAPHLQELDQSNNLSSGQADALSKLLQDTPMGKQIVSFKVWDTRGRLLYSTDPSAVGKSFPMHEGLLRARLGEIVSQISNLDEVENADLKAEHDQLLETYSPVWLSGTDQVIAVAEFYQTTTELKQETSTLARRSWLVVGFSILLVYLLLAGFVRNASRTIHQQQDELNNRMSELTVVLEQNRELHERVRRASARVAQLNESQLRRVGSELHDGPAQELGLSILKLDAQIGKMEKIPQAGLLKDVLEELNGIDASLQSALKEMRSIAAGLSLPQLAELSLPAAITRVVRSHERRTGSQVMLDLQTIPENASLPLKITVYRLIQQALNNSYQHAGGVGQRVIAVGVENELFLEISDDGPGFDPGRKEENGRLGLSGMRERVESIGGNFEIESSAGKGTKICARLPHLSEGETSL